MYYRNMNTVYDLGTDVVHEIRIIVWTCGNEYKSE